MIKDLAILEIPKDEESLKKVLKKVKELTWNEEAISDWVDDKKTHSIYYTSQYNTYMYSDNNKLPIGIKVLTFKELMS